MTSSLLKAIVGIGTAKCYVSQNKVHVCTCVLLSSKYKRNIAHVYQLKNNKTWHGNNLNNHSTWHVWNRRRQREGDQRFYFSVSLLLLLNITSENDGILAHISHSRYPCLSSPNSVYVTGDDIRGICSEV